MKIKSIKKVILDSPKQYYDVIDATPFHNFFIKTDSGYVVSHNCNFTDEVNFGLTSDVEKLKKKQKQLISQIDARMASRFLRGNYLPTLNIIASSKNSDQSFLEDYIDNKRKNNSTTTLIVDEPQWVVDSRKDSDKHFYVAIGNRELANELLPMDADEQMANTYRDKGYKIYEVPSGYREKFEDNLDSSITDIIGIATQSGMKYISGVRWKEAKTTSFQNPFTKETIECGTGKDDTSQYSDYFDLTKIPEEVKSMPLFIHLDMSQGNNGTGDKTGIAGVFITGKKPKIEGEDSSKELFFRLGFHVGIKAPKGQSISFDKHRTFIRWLRNKGFKIKGVSSDTYQNGQLSQQLIADGFDYKVISVDRLDTESKIQLQYAYFKSTLYDRRIEIYDNCKELTEEVLGLERESDGHINHPNNGQQGSKDMIDGVVGCLWNASQHADQFAFDYGESLDLMRKVSMESPANSTNQKQQVKMQFEDELRQLFTGKYAPTVQTETNNVENKTETGDKKHDNSNNKQSGPFLDFGVGSAQTYQPQYTQNGIILW